MNTVSHEFSQQTPLSTAAGTLLGTSAVMQEVFRLIERVGPTDACVLLTGESGTGKELAARSIHEYSPRCSGPFVAIHCGAMSAGLSNAKVFERAEGGTLLLDEVTEMPLDMQTRLLRVLAATNRCPLQAVQNGQLREDLLYRLAVFPVRMPPLRERGDDVDLLAGHFLAELNARSRTQKRLSALARMTLRQHSWPGNVRELRNCIERAFILGDTVLELAPLMQGSMRDAERVSEDKRLDIRVGSRIHDMERSLIEATLDYFHGNKRRAADALGCSLKTLYNKLNGYSQSQECANT